MPKDESMDVRITILDLKVDDLIGKVATIQQEMATKSDIVNLQRQLDAMERQLVDLRGEIERSAANASLRLEQRLESEIKQLASKAELQKAINKAILKGSAIQTAINMAMISVVVQFLR